MSRFSLPFNMAAKNLLWLYSITRPLTSGPFVSPHRCRIYKPTKSNFFLQLLQIHIYLLRIIMKSILIWWRTNSKSISYPTITIKFKSLSLRIFLHKLKTFKRWITFFVCWHMRINYKVTQNFFIVYKAIKPLLSLKLPFHVIKACRHSIK